MANTDNEFTVTINERPLGVRFTTGFFKQHQKQTVAILQQVLIDFHGFKIGLEAGDILVAVNNQSVAHLESSKALQIFRSQPVPFNATFNRLLIETEEEEEDIYCNDEYSLWSSYVNSNTLPSFNTNTLHSLNTYLSDCSDTSSLNPFTLFAKSVSGSTSISADTADDNFIFIDQSDIDEYKYIDQSTKNLVAGFLRNLQFSLANTAQSTSKPNIIEILTARYAFNNSVMFDKRVEKWTAEEENIKVTTASSNGFKYGIHGWSIKILKCDVYRQEIGIIENFDDLQNIICLKGSVANTPQFGARAIYGNELYSCDHYYASYNDNGNVRC
eukprot:935036_1